MHQIVIAIDGYSACGKSTLARQLAARLGYTYIDSGAMYRAITLKFMRERVDLHDRAAVTEALRDIVIEWRPSRDGRSQELWLNGENVEKEIRGMQVASRVSEVAAVPAVREVAVARQREMGREGGIVMDGRDVGTVVFPRAELKLFMTASREIRIQRRYKEALEKHQEVTLAEVAENLDRRDYVDTHRAVGPLRRAPDAIVLDNSALTPEEQLQMALALVARAFARSTAS